MTLNLSTDDNNQSDTLSGFENAIGSIYGDTIIGTSGDNTISGGAGDDTILGGGGSDELHGGAGDGDTIDYSDIAGPVDVDLSNQSNNQFDTLTGFENATGSGSGDTLTGSGTANVLTGGAGNDTLRGNGGADTLLGGSGNDTLLGGADGDTLNGGTNTDTVSYAHLAAGVIANLDGAGDDVIIDVENLTGSGFADVLTGDDQTNTIHGGEGNDTIRGGGGSDALHGEGGTGDTIDYSDATGTVTLNLDTNVNNQSDTLTGFENAIGSDSADTLVGSGVSNTISGGDGNDTILGGGGSDTLSGGDGIGDTIDYSDATGDVTLNLDTNVNNQDDTLSGFENATGSDFNDTLVGDSGANHIIGGDGADTIIGGGGTDILDGGDGSADWIDYSDAAGSVEDQPDNRNEQPGRYAAELRAHCGFRPQRCADRHVRQQPHSGRCGQRYDLRSGRQRHARRRRG